MSKLPTQSTMSTDLPKINRANSEVAEPLATPSSSARNTLMEKAEWGAISASLGGTVAAIFLQQLAFAAIPLSISVALSACNRKKLSDRIAKDITSLQSAVCAQAENLKLLQEKHDTEFTRISLQFKEMSENINDLQVVARNLRSVQNSTQQILNDSSSAEAFYLRAIGHHRLGDLQEAVLDYSETITRDSKHAKAYYNRGIVNSKLGKKQEAVDDLRDAAKAFFEEGNIDAYSKSKELASNMHELEKQEIPEDFGDKSSVVPEVIVMEGLF